MLRSKNYEFLFSILSKRILFNDNITWPNFVTNTTTLELFNFDVEIKCKKMILKVNDAKINPIISKLTKLLEILDH